MRLAHNQEDGSSSLPAVTPSYRSCPLNKLAVMDDAGSNPVEGARTLLLAAVMGTGIPQKLKPSGLGVRIPSAALALVAQ